MIITAVCAGTHTGNDVGLSLDMCLELEHLWIRLWVPAHAAVINTSKAFNGFRAKDIPLHVVRISCTHDIFMM